MAKFGNFEGISLAITYCFCERETFAIKILEPASQVGQTANLPPHMPAAGRRKEQKLEYVREKLAAALLSQNRIIVQLFPAAWAPDHTKSSGWKLTGFVLLAPEKNNEKKLI